MLHADFSIVLLFSPGCAIAQVISRRFSTLLARVRSQVIMWDLLWTKGHWRRVSLSTSVSPANFHSTKCFIRVYHTGGTADQLGADVPSGLTVTQPNETKKELFFIREDGGNMFLRNVS
jgi:hypothetical protein